MNKAADGETNPDENSDAEEEIIAQNSDNEEDFEESNEADE